MTGRNEREGEGERERERSPSTVILRKENQVRKCRDRVFELSSPLFWSQNEVHQKYYRQRLSGGIRHMQFE